MFSAQHLQEDLQYLTMGKKFFSKVHEKKQVVVELLTYQREHKVGWVLFACLFLV